MPHKIPLAKFYRSSAAVTICDSHLDGKKRRENDEGRKSDCGDLELERRHSVLARAGAAAGRPHRFHAPLGSMVRSAARLQPMQIGQAVAATQRNCVSRVAIIIKG